MDFIPNLNTNQPETVYFEDSSDVAVSGADLRKPLTYYQSNVSIAIGKLGGIVTAFIPGVYPTHPKRYGYRIHFVINGTPGRIDIAALPMRTEAPVKKEKSLKQSLYLLWKELDAMSDAWAYKPGSFPLIPYLIGASGRTVTEELIIQGALPDVAPVAYIPEVSSAGGKG